MLFNIIDKTFQFKFNSAPHAHMLFDLVRQGQGARVPLLALVVAKAPLLAVPVAADEAAERLLARVHAPAERGFRFPFVDGNCKLSPVKSQNHVFFVFFSFFMMKSKEQCCSASVI
jgi:hypothetical protein